MRRGTLIVCLLWSGCKAHQLVHEQPSSPQPAPEHYRPGWTASIPTYLDAITACIADRDLPTTVVHVQLLAQSGTGVTAVDGAGAIENCLFDNGKVLLREPAPIEPDGVVGLPVFALGAQEPRVPPGVLAEEVLHDDAVIGWLFWPRERAPSTGRDPEAP